MSRATPGLAVLTVLAVVSACGPGRAEPTLEVSGAWSRPTPVGADEAVVYLTLSVDRSDALVGASVPTSVARAVALHVGAAGGGGHHQHGGSASGGDLATMAEVDQFDLRPDEPLVLEPGGNHAMLVGLVRPLAVRDSFALTLRLASGRRLEVMVPVAVNPPG